MAGGLRRELVRRAAGLRVVFAPVPADLARLEVALGLVEVEREAVDFAALARAGALRAGDLRAAGLRAVVLRGAPPLPLVLREEPALEDASLADQLPLMTRCAASATASAMRLPSLVALDIMLVAACDAVSAASSPASRILRRALGLALMAAAAAASPAASISLLIAAFAILSTVVLSLPDEEPEELFFADFAIVDSSLCVRKDTRQP